MKIFVIVLAVWAIAIVAFFAGLWCGKRLTEMKYGTLEDDKKQENKNER